MYLIVDLIILHKHRQFQIKEELVKIVFNIVLNVHKLINVLLVYKIIIYKAQMFAHNSVQMDIMELLH